MKYTHHRNIHKVAIEMFKVKKGACPDFILELFENYNGRNTRTRRDFYRPNNDTVFKGEISFRSFGPIVWDKMLPSQCKSCENVDKF